MSYLQKQARAQEKRRVLLQFIASETYSDLNTCAELLGVSETNVRATLKSLENVGAVTSEGHFIQGRQKLIFGITSHGNGLLGLPENTFFKKSSVNSSYIQHTLQIQKIRIRAERLGYSWTPIKVLRTWGLKKIPDALATDPSGKKISIEIERTIKSRKRYEEIASAHLQARQKKLWDQVHYVCPKDGLAKRLKAIFLSIKTVPVEGARVALKPEHYSVFSFFDLSSWPKEKGGV